MLRAGGWAFPAIPLLLTSVLLAQSPIEPTDELQELRARLDAQDAEISFLRDQLTNPSPVFASAPLFDDCLPGDDCIDRPERTQLPLTAEVPIEDSCDASGNAKSSLSVPFYADYDRGFLIRPFDPDEHPFLLRINGWIQFRHHAFDRDVDSWTDNAGTTRPIRSRNAFDIERARLVFSGYAVDERLTYFLQLDGDTDDGHIVDFFDYWWAWKFDDALNVQLGKRKVPAVRQWLLGARDTRFVDRPISCDFFRPDRTVGIFAEGDIGTMHYEAMVGNGYQSANRPEFETDSSFTYAATSYWDPLGPYGPGLTDPQMLDDLRIRFGHSFVFSPQRNIEDEIVLNEADFLRLTDGTRLTAPGALAPGVTVRGVDLYLYGLDFAAKWAGWSLNSEVFFRWLQDFEATGPVPYDGLFARGFYVEGGRFLVKDVLDINARYGQIDGLFGNSSEIAGGFNWYPLKKKQLKISFDVTSIDSSPHNGTASDVLVGDDGTLFRTQLQAEF